MARTSPVNAGWAIINGAGTGTNGDRIDVWIEYALAEQDISNNRSRVVAKFYAALTPGKSSSTYGGNGCYSSFSVAGISGGGLKSNGSYDFRNTNTINDLGTFDGWIGHNADGTLTITLSGSFTTTSSWITGGNAAGNYTLPTIPRASSLSFGAFTMGAAGHITIHRAPASFTHRLVYYFGAANGEIVNGAGDGTYWTPPIALANQVPSAVYGVGTIVCETYSGGTHIGSTSYQFGLYVPGSVVPGCSILSEAKVNSNATIAAWDEFVKGYSALKIIALGTGVYGSAIVSYSFTVKKGDVVAFATTQAGHEWTTGIFTDAGVYSIYLTVTDSRGRTNSTSSIGTITVRDYSSPSISLADVFRCTSAGVLDLVDGTYISAKATFSYASVNGKNSVTKKIEYRQYGASTLTLGQNNPDDNTAYVIGGGAISKDYSYEIVFSITDAVVGTVTLSLFIKPGFVLLHFRHGGKGLGIGGAADADELQVYMPTKWKDWLFQVGDYWISENSTSPATRFGGVWTRVSDVFLYGATDAYPYVTGNVGGAKTATLTQANLPNFNMDVIAQGTMGRASQRIWGDMIGGGSETIATYETNTGIVAKSNKAYVNSGGSGVAIDKMPPYRAVYMWRRTA